MEGCYHHSTHLHFSSFIIDTFLAHGRKERTGLLQRFLPPLGPCNTVIRSIYTPKLCVLERRKNKLQLHDSRFGLYERAITFEGPDIHSTPSPLRGNILPTKIQALCDEVVEHVQNVTIGGRIIRMVANWKVDEKGKIWLLFTTCIRVEGSCRSKYAEFNSLYKGASSSQSLLNIEPMMKLPNAVHLEQNPNHDLSTGVNNYITTASCPSCCKNECETMFHPIPYKTIIAHFEQVLKMISREKEGETEVVLDWPPDSFIIKAAGGVGFGMIQDKFKKYDRDWDAEEVIIPPVMRYLHNRLKIEGYRKYRQDPLFLHKKCNVCEQCFLSYAELSSSNFQIADPIRLDGSGAIERRRKKRQQAIEMSRTHGEQLVGNKWIPMDEEKETTVFTKTFKKHFGEENGHARDFGDIPHFPDAIVSHSFDGKDITKHEYSDTSMQDFIKQRERIFFKEIALQGKHAIEGHALSHLISAQSTLEQSQRIGKKQNEKKEKNPYEEVLKFVDSTSSKVKKKENKWANKTRLPYPPLKSENNQQIDFSQKGI